MSVLRQVMAVIIMATLPLVEDPKAVADLLREAAMKAGCKAPSVAMFWRGEGDNTLQIEVTCRPEAGNDGRHE